MGIECGAQRKLRAAFCRGGAHAVSFCLWQNETRRRSRRLQRLAKLNAARALCVGRTYLGFAALHRVGDKAKTTKAANICEIGGVRGFRSVCDIPHFGKRRRCRDSAYLCAHAVSFCLWQNETRRRSRRLQRLAKLNAARALCVGRTYLGFAALHRVGDKAKVTKAANVCEIGGVRGFQ